MRRILFLSRKRRGIGGMQRQNRDLKKSLSLEKDLHVRCHGVFGLLSVPWADQVHLGDAALSPIGALVKWVAPQKRVTLSAHGLDVVYPSKIYQHILRWSLRSMDAVCCVSGSTREEILRRGVPDDRVSVVPCGIYSSEAVSRKPPDAPKLLLVGRGVPRKGFAWFCDQVLPALHEAMPTLCCCIIGAEPDRFSMQSYIERRGLGTWVTLLGEVDDAELEREYRSASVLVVPNIKVEGDMEGFGIVCIEASVRGVPVAAAAIEGLRDAVIEGKTGHFFTPGDAASAKGVILSMLEHPLDPEMVTRSTLESYNLAKLFSLFREHVLQCS